MQIWLRRQAKRLMMPLGAVAVVLVAGPSTELPAIAEAFLPAVASAVDCYDDKICIEEQDFCWSTCVSTELACTAIHQEEGKVCLVTFIGGACQGGGCLQHFYCTTALDDDCP